MSLCEDIPVCDNCGLPAHPETTCVAALLSALYWANLKANHFKDRLEKMPDSSLQFKSKADMDAWIDWRGQTFYSDGRPKLPEGCKS